MLHWILLFFIGSALIEEDVSCKGAVTGLPKIDGIYALDNTLEAETEVYNSELNYGIQ